MQTFLKFIALIALVIFVITFTTSLLTFLLIMIGLMIFAWVCGVPITITENGHKRVYRWMKRIR